MLSFVTLDHIFGNLSKQVTPRSYENIVKMLSVCLPLEATGKKPINIPYVLSVS